MKFVLSFLFFFLLSDTVFGASKLTIHLSQCRMDCDTETGVFRLYLDGKLIKKSKKQKTEITDLNPGNYALVFTTLIKRKKRIDFVLLDNQDIVLRLCFDDFEYEKITRPAFIDQLQAGDSLQLFYCATKSKIKDTILVVRDENNFRLVHKTTNRAMTDIEVEIMREYDYFLANFARKGWFGRAEKYTLETKMGKVKLKDRSDWWHGFHFLLLDLRLIDADSCPEA